jgi:hypothetical protein
MNIKKAEIKINSQPFFHSSNHIFLEEKPKTYL